MITESELLYPSYLIESEYKLLSYYIMKAMIEFNISDHPMTGEPKLEICYTNESPIDLQPLFSKPDRNQPASRLIRVLYLKDNKSKPIVYATIEVIKTWTDKDKFIVDIKHRFGE